MQSLFEIKTGRKRGENKEKTTNYKFILACNHYIMHIVQITSSFLPEYFQAV
jgi:hypothetical protein